MKADVVTSEDCFKSIIRSTRWTKMTKEESIRALRQHAISQDKHGDYLEYEGLDIYLGHGYIEFRPLFSDMDSLIVSDDAVCGIHFYYRDGSSGRPYGLRIWTDYGVFTIALEDRDGQA